MVCGVWMVECFGDWIFVGFVVIHCVCYLYNCMWMFGWCVMVVCLVFV